jgi:O-acetyl-ADP-ribose deacetylase (regulator of RNase III)
MTRPGHNITVIQGDITRQHVDAIVNAANKTLLGGGGVDGAIHRTAGPDLLEECRALGGCLTGEARITAGYDLPSSYVIHTVGPVWQGGAAGEDELLAACHVNSLRVGAEHGLRTIAFPAIGCGAYRFPVRRAAGIALQTVASFLENDDSYDEVRFVCFEDATFDAFSEAAREVLSGGDHKSAEGSSV